MFRFIKALRTRRQRYVWYPALDLRDARVAATLMTFSSN